MSPHIVNKLYIHNQYRPTYSSNLKLMTSRCQINELWLPKEQVFRQHLPSRQDWAILKCENVVLEIPYEAQCYPSLITLSWPHPCIMYKTCNGHVSPGLNKIQTQPNTHLWIPRVSRLGARTMPTMTCGKGFSHPLPSSKEWSYSGKWSSRGFWPRRAFHLSHSISMNVLHILEKPVFHFFCRNWNRDLMDSRVAVVSDMMRCEW